MAQENDNNRKSRRNFDLEKPVKRSFDLEKEIPQEAASLHQHQQPENVPPMDLPEPPETGKPMKMTWIWVCSIIVLVIIVIACIRGCDSAEKAVEPQQAEQLQAPAPADEQETDASAQTQAATETEAADSVAADAAASAASAEEAATPYEPQQPQTEPSPAVTPSASPSIDLEAEAARVIRGDYGNGDERRARLGENYRAVQNVVNRMLAQ